MFMMNNKILIGWDIGGANTKICVFDSNYNIIDTYSENLKIWENFSNLRSLFTKVYNKYETYEVSNFITITAESCDNFLERNDGILKIIELCKNHMLGKNFYFSNDGNYIDYSAALLKPNKLFSTNWMLSLNFLNLSRDIDVLIDIGSTTTDIIYKNMSVKDNVSDYQRLCNNTLVYVGVVRTPLSMLIDSVNYRNNLSPLINEVYATTGDIFNITKDIDFTNSHYRGADGKSFTRENSLIRLGRNIGFDYNPNDEKYLVEISKKIKREIIKKIFSCLTNRLDIKLNNSIISSVGEGNFLVKELCEKNNIIYKPIETIKNDLLKKNIYQDVYKNFPSALVVLNSINKEYEKI